MHFVESSGRAMKWKWSRSTLRAVRYWQCPWVFGQNGTLRCLSVDSSVLLAMSGMRRWNAARWPMRWACLPRIHGIVGWCDRREGEAGEAERAAARRIDVIPRLLPYTVNPVCSTMGERSALSQKGSIWRKRHKRPFKPIAIQCLFQQSQFNNCHLLLSLIVMTQN